MVQQFSTPWTFYLLDGVTLTFAYPWRIGASSDLEVYIAGVLTTAYTLTGIDNATGGNVVLFAAGVAGQILFIRRVTPQTQLYDPVANDPFTPEALEAALDKLTREIQDLYERIARAPAFAVDAPNVYRNLVFPTAVAGKVIGWSASGTQLTLYDQAVHQAIVDPTSGEVHGQSTVLVPSVGGASFLTASAFIPPAVELAGVGYRVVTTFSVENGLASIDLGGMGVESRWGAALGRTAASVNNAGQWVGGRVTTDTAHDVVLLANPPGALFGVTGTARLTAFWTSWVPL